MTLWYETPGPEPVPAVEVAALGGQLLRERDKALSECAAAGTQLAAAKRQIADLLEDLQALRERKFGQDRANAVRKDEENRELHLRIEEQDRELAVLRALVGEPVAT